MQQPVLTINHTQVTPGERITLDLPVTRLYTHTPVTMPVHVVHGKRPGPRLFGSAAIHGDEINGVEIIRRLLKRKALRQLRGTLIAVPIVNVHGFLAHSRYLPDRRDLNRAFPGSEKGSLAARLAQLFMREVVSNCTHGIDLHTGSLHRSNLPQVRADLSDAQTRRLAQVFGVPVLINANLRDGSLRQAAAERGIISLLYEAGEALRFDESAIRIGLGGTLAVMRALGMIADTGARRKPAEPLVAQSTRWVRAPKSGVLRALVALGTRVRKGSTLGVITDPFGESEEPIIAPTRGIIVSRINLPLVNEGEALFHIARLQRTLSDAALIEPRAEASEATLATSP
jgi:predicted deacylase